MKKESFRQIFQEFIITTTDRIESINRLMGHVHLKPIYVEEDEFVEGFNPSILDEQNNPERKHAREVVMKVLKQMAAVGNSCLKRNADAWLCKLRIDKDIFCFGGRIPKGKFALTY